MGYIEATMKRLSDTRQDAILILGLFLLLGGCLLLFFTTGTLKAFGTIVPSAFILGGVAVFSVTLKKSFRSRWLFFSSVAILSGMFLLLFNLDVFGVGFLRLWPVVPAIIGFSLFPSGLKKYGRPRARFVMPAVLFLCLSFLFFLFSFRVIPLSFREFITYYWPVFFVAAGGGLLILYLLNRFDVIRSRPPR
jgi:hypothetical protein